MSVVECGRQLKHKTYGILCGFCLFGFSHIRGIPCFGNYSCSASYQKQAARGPIRFTRLDNPPDWNVGGSKFVCFGPRLASITQVFVLYFLLRNRFVALDENEMATYSAEPRRHRGAVPIRTQRSYRNQHQGQPQISDVIRIDNFLTYMNPIRYGRCGLQQFGTTTSSRWQSTGNHQSATVNLTPGESMTGR